MVLHDNWQMREEAVGGDDGGKFSQPGFDGKSWYATSVPTTVLGTLVRHGVYPDPYIGTNNMFIPDASLDHNHRFNLDRFSHLPDKSNPWAKPYWFRTEFQIPNNYRDNKVWLHLDGINYRADVWLNGKKITDAKEIAGMFKRFRFEVSAGLKEKGNNALAIRIYPLDHPGDPLHEQLDGLTGGFGPNAGDGEILRNVTDYCAVGWDWIPAVRDRNMGLWQHVWLEASGPVAVRDVAVFTDVNLPSAKEAALTIRCQLDNAAKVGQTVELVGRIKPDGFPGIPIEIHAKIVLSTNKISEIILKPSDYPTLVLMNPRLWWPVTYGEQPLYTISLEAWVNGRSSSVVTSHFGVRTVGTLIIPGGGRAFTVNGRTIRMTGGAWVPDMMMSWSAQRYRDEVRLMSEANHTVVRVNGCGIVPPDVFFEECDRRGLLVWQDLSRTSIQGFAFRRDGKDGWGPVDCDDPALYLDNMTDCIMRLRGHPSLLVWCGSNEKFPQANVGETLQNDLLPALDGTRPWLTSSDENAPWRKEDNGFWSGGPYQLVRLPEYYKLYATDPKFASKNEIGLASPPPINTIAKFIPDFDQPDASSFPLNRTFGYHDATDKYYRASHTIMREDLGEPAGMNDYLWMADLYNGASYRAIFEAANKSRPLNSGTHLWKVNAAWPSMMWQVFDWILHANGGYYSMKEACKPLHIQESEDDQGIQVVSTLPVAKNGLRVQVGIVSLDGKPEWTGEYAVDAAADATTTVTNLPQLAADDNLRFLSLDLFDKSGELLDHQVKWVQRDCKWQQLLKLPTADVEATVVAQHQVAKETVYDINVVNHATFPAVDVSLQVLQGTQGWEVLPSFWTDNALTMLPGEKRQLTVRFRTSLLNKKVPHLIVEGWNVTPKEINVLDGKPVVLGLKLVSCKFNHLTDAYELSVQNTGASGPRLTTWPLDVMTDGRLMRSLRIAVSSSQPVSIKLPVSDLGVGTHTIGLGNENPISFALRPP